MGWGPRSKRAWRPKGLPGPGGFIPRGAGARPRGGWIPTWTGWGAPNFNPGGHPWGPTKGGAPGGGFRRFPKAPVWGPQKKGPFLAPKLPKGRGKWEISTPWDYPGGWPVTWPNPKGPWFPRETPKRPYWPLGRRGNPNFGGRLLRKVTPGVPWRPRGWVNRPRNPGPRFKPLYWGSPRWLEGVSPRPLGKGWAGPLFHLVLPQGGYFPFGKRAGGAPLFWDPGGVL